uniref:Uncharacterized protein n=1 Tax=Arundo donax TaxID=35708 RepID=A0A0A9A4Q4_ARUDO
MLAREGQRKKLKSLNQKLKVSPHLYHPDPLQAAARFGSSMIFSMGVQGRRDEVTWSWCQGGR